MPPFSPFYFVFLLPWLLKCPQPLPLNHLILPPSSHRVPPCRNPQSSPGHHTVQPALLTTRAFTCVAPWSPSGRSPPRCPAGFRASGSHPSLPVASPLVPGAVSSASAFHFPQKQRFNFLFYLYSLHFQNSCVFPFLELPLLILYLLFSPDECHCLLDLCGLTLPGGWHGAQPCPHRCHAAGGRGLRWPECSYPWYR